MKKRTILSLAIASIVFAVIAFQLNKEAIAQPPDTPVTVSILTTDSMDHGSYTVELVNLTTHEIRFLQPMKKPGVYPAMHGGGCPSPLNTDNFLVHVCSTQRWGVISWTFQMDETPVNITLTAGSLCPAYGFKFE